jgi:hypothetical protein
VTIAVTVEPKTVTAPVHRIEADLSDNDPLAGV